MMIKEQIKELKKDKITLSKRKVRSLKVNTSMNIDEISEIVSNRLLNKLENTFANNVYSK